jgi:uncharacterized protein YkwD
MTRAPGRRRLASLLLLAVLGAVLAGPSIASASETIDGAAISAAETAMVAALNKDRTALGLIPVRVDTRLMAIARARSDDMIANNYFSHTYPNGKNVFWTLTNQSISWYNAGEIIAWNNYPMSMTVEATDSQWMHSAGHKAIVIGKDFNYVGVGLAVDTGSGKKMWTAVYMKGPDRTGAKATTYTPTVRAGTTSATRKTKLTWNGADVKLQVLTAGLASFRIERKFDDGDWTVLNSATTLKYTNYTLAVGHRYEWRIAARDKKGNLGAWSTKVIDLR